MTTTTTNTARLASFASDLRFDDVPASVIARTEDLMTDWLGSVFAGRQARPVRSIESFARAMGPADGPSEVLTSGARSSPIFAATVNAAASHIAESTMCTTAPSSIWLPSSSLPRLPWHRLSAQAAGSCWRPASPDTRWESARVSSLAARTTKCSTQPARPAPWPQRPLWATCWAWTSAQCCMHSALPGRRRPDCGSFCGPRQTRSNCTPRTPPRPG